MACERDRSLLQAKEVVSRSDSAIDRESSRVDDYVKQGYPRNYQDFLKFSGTPTLWKIGTLDPEVKGLIEEDGIYFVDDELGRRTQRTNSMLIAMKAFRYGILGWSNFDADAVFVKDEHGKRCLDGEVLLDITRTNEREVREIGGLIWRSAGLDDARKNS